MLIIIIIINIIIFPQGELTRVTSQLEETKSTYENEVSRLRTKLQEKSDALVRSWDVLILI